MAISLQHSNTSGHSVRAPRRFLPEVQALRALAVGLVVVYHFYPRALPGGFVGVDVFFVISGFLITGHLLREVEQKGRVDLARFWAARVRRIMPAALVTILAVLVMTVLFFPATMWGRVTKEAVASALSVENWVLALDSVDYLASSNSPTALQHFWSLGVEEQFYVVWPLVVLLAWFIASKWRAHRAMGRRVRLDTRRTQTVRWWATVLFGVVFIASLVLSIVLVKQGDPSAYFATWTRVWELAAGGILAAILPASGWGAPVWVRNLVALGGLATLVAVGLTYTAATPFPGHGAVLPVLGTMAIIAAGRTEGPGSLHRLVDLPPVQWVGNVSYSLYLWHWPVAVAVAQLAGKKPTWWEAIMLTVLSLLLAAASYYLVERPARQFKPLARRTWSTLGAGLVATALVGAVAFVPHALAGQQAASQEQAADALLASGRKGLGAEAWKGWNGAPFVNGTTLIPAPDRVFKDKTPPRDCFPRLEAKVVPGCTLMPDGSIVADVNGVSADHSLEQSKQKTIAIVGDSHAEQWFTPISMLARDAKWRVRTFVKQSCPFNDVPRTIERDANLVCTDPNRATLKSLVKEKPDVVLMSTWGNFEYVSDPRPGFERQIKALQSAGIRVVVIHDTPTPQEHQGKERPVDCIVANKERPEVCSTPRKAAMKHDTLFEVGKKLGTVDLIDLTDSFCSETTCPALVGNVLVFRDANHISDSYMKSLLPDLKAALPRGVLSAS